MTDPRHIAISEFDYALPEDRIALHPLEERDASKLLVYEKGNITDAHYRDLPLFLPEQGLIVFNDTRVIRARILFQKESGGVIEIFCLEPAEMISDYQWVMNRQGSVRWKCMIGGASKWKNGPLVKKLTVDGNEVLFTAQLIEKQPEAYVVEFSWQPASLAFASLIEAAGKIPLPPYIKRDTDISDTERYQTIYAREAGSVAAPTAGLHFTPGLMDALRAKRIETGFVTLHVGAGTFKPVKAETMEDHAMHAEWIDVSLAFIEKLAAQREKVTAVGTTSARTLESLYWMGVKLALDPSVEHIELGQWDVYDAQMAGNTISTAAALLSLAGWMQGRGMQRLYTQTRLLIAPGYRYRTIHALITNFHQPKSTLLLLVAAAVGDDWKRIYRHALENGYRFLSYGDGCLLKL